MDKQFTYNDSDIKGSPFLIEDCRNSYIYYNLSKIDTDIEIIEQGIYNNLNDYEILKLLPNVRCDNIKNIMAGIRSIRNYTPVNEKAIFEKHLFSVLMSLGFDLNNYKIRTKVKNRLNCSDEYSLFIDVLESFVKFCNSANQDVIDLIFKT